jgi:hypothetical protein
MVRSVKHALFVLLGSTKPPNISAYRELASGKEDPTPLSGRRAQIIVEKN